MQQSPLVDGGHSISPSVSPSPTSSSASHQNQNQTIPAARPGDKRSPAHAAAAELDSRSKRAQVSRACQRCRNLRRACSEYRPCKRCLDQGLGEQCLVQPGPVQIAWHSTSPNPQTQTPQIHAQSLHAQSLHVSPQSTAFQRMAELLPLTVVDYCVGRFFARLYPTIPIMVPEYIAQLKLAARAGPASEAAMEAQCLLTAMCSLVLLQVEEPESLFLQGLISEKNAAYGQRLFDGALAAHGSFARSSNPSLELCLLTFFLYACHGALLHHSQAFLFLRESTTLWLLLRPCGNPSSSSTSFRFLADRLFWTLLISERSHAIRYRRPVTLQITAETPSPDDNPSLAGFWTLAALFRPLDTWFISLVNQEQIQAHHNAPAQTQTQTQTQIQATQSINSPLNPGPPHPPPASQAIHASLTYIERAIKTAINPTIPLQDTQKANLRVTQMWLRIILWQLRLRLGHLTTEEASPGLSENLTYQYPLVVARDLTLSTHHLPVDSIKVHGVGLTEKLFDIASAMVDVLARIPIAKEGARVAREVGNDSWAGRSRSNPEDDLKYLRRLITQLPGGKAIYDELLRKHLQQAMPG